MGNLQYVKASVFNKRCKKSPFSVHQEKRIQKAQLLSFYAEKKICSRVHSFRRKQTYGLKLLIRLQVSVNFLPQACHLNSNIHFIRTFDIAITLDCDVINCHIMSHFSVDFVGVEEKEPGTTPL